MKKTTASNILAVSALVAAVTVLLTNDRGLETQLRACSDPTSVTVMSGRSIPYTAENDSTYYFDTPGIGYSDPPRCYQQPNP